MEKPQTASHPRHNSDVCANDVGAAACIQNERLCETSTEIIQVNNHWLRP